MFTHQFPAQIVAHDTTSPKRDFPTQNRHNNVISLSNENNDGCYVICGGSEQLHTCVISLHSRHARVSDFKCIHSQPSMPASQQLMYANERNSRSRSIIYVLVAACWNVRYYSPDYYWAFSSLIYLMSTNQRHDRSQFQRWSLGLKINKQNTKRCAILIPTEFLLTWKSKKKMCMLFGYEKK